MLALAAATAASESVRLASAVSISPRAWVFWARAVLAANLILA